MRRGGIRRPCASLRPSAEGGFVLKLTTFASGSGGNCLLVSQGNTHALVDAGISARRITQGLAALGLTPGDLDAVFITHEHSDHINGLNTLLKRWPVPLYATAATGRRIAERSAWAGQCLHTIEAGTGCSVGELTVTAFSTLHDAADSVGYVLESGGRRAAVATDLGRVTDRVREAVAGSVFALVETNYEPDWLLDGPYPPYLKHRILGERGHLSNEAGADLACFLAGEGAKTLLLGHLSRENNTPARARAVVEAALEQRGLLDRCRVQVAPREQPGQSWEV